jgi:hypothetical protein
MGIGIAWLACGPEEGRAQYLDLWQQPQRSEPAMFEPRLKYIKMDVEAERDTLRSSLGGSEVRTERLYLAPALGIGWNGYVYHPYLLTYSGLFEPGYIVQESGLAGSLHHQDDLTLNGSLRATILEVKPYASSLSFSRAHTETKYDLFNSALVDSQGWGATTGYREGLVPVTLSFQQTHEDSSGFNQRTLTDQTTLDLHARNDRPKDNATDFTYQYGEFDRQTDLANSSFRSENSYHHVTATDTEHFRQSSLRSSLLFYDIESLTSSSLSFNGTLNYNLEHTPHLRSYYNYALSEFSGNDSDALQNYAVAGAQHQLYESLTSGLDIHGTTLDSSAGTSTLDSWGVGTSGSVDYTKRLGGWGRLSIGNTTTYNWTHQETSGSELLIADEAHIVPADLLVRLNQPRDTAILSVTDSNHIALAPTDYAIVTSTDPWQIQILNPPSTIKAGDLIFVTYTAQSSPSGSYAVLGNQSQLSLRFWKDRANVFVRYRFADTEASSPEFLFQNEDEFQTGAELTWLGFALHGDYTDHRSTLYDYKSYNLSESYSRNVWPDSTAGIDLNQQWTTFSSGFSTTPNETQNETFYSFMFHYDWHPRVGFNWSAEAGYRQQRGLGLDQDLFAARTYLNWMLGKLEVHVGYEHENQQLTRETRTRDFAFLRVRRSF